MSCFPLLLKSKSINEITNNKQISVYYSLVVLFYPYLPRSPLMMMAAAGADRDPARPGGCSLPACLTALAGHNTCCYHTALKTGAINYEIRNVL